MQRLSGYWVKSLPNNCLSAWTVAGVAVVDSTPPARIDPSDITATLYPRVAVFALFAILGLIKFAGCPTSGLLESVLKPGSIDPAGRTVPSGMIVGSERNSATARCGPP